MLVAPIACAPTTATAPPAAVARQLSTPRATTTPPTEPLGIVLAWIECEDQCEGQLEAVVQLGAEATPLLIGTLIEGPPPERLEAMQAHLARAYEELVAYGKTHSDAAVELEGGQYINLYLDNYVAQYRIRSAQALATIGDPEAGTALERALQTAKRDDVRQALERALRELGQ